MLPLLSERHRDGRRWLTVYPLDLARTVLPADALLWRGRYVGWSADYPRGRVEIGVARRRAPAKASGAAVRPACAPRAPGVARSAPSAEDSARHR